MKYSARQEAVMAIRQFTKAMATVRAKYPEKQADRIIERMIADKFGTDADLSVIALEFEKGQYDRIIGRMRQADRVRGNNNKMVQQVRQQLLEEMTLLYCSSKIQEPTLAPPPVIAPGFVNRIRRVFANA